jgi:hypothetical protein
MGLVHHNLERPVHDLKHFLGIELFGHGCVIGHIGKQNGYDFPLAFQGAAGREDFVGKVLGGIRLGFGIIYLVFSRWFSKIIPATTAEFIFGEVSKATFGAHNYQLFAAFSAKLS